VTGVRLLLVRHAATAETRRAAFPSTTGAVQTPGCQPLDRAGTQAASVLGPLLPRADRVRASHARRARSTATAAGLHAEVDADLAECDFGRWAGRTPDEVHAADPDALAAWYADPSLAPHGGEALSRVRVRARSVLARAAAERGTTVAISHGGLIKAALLEVLGLGDAAIWKLDAAPCSVTELCGSDVGGVVHWRVARIGWTPQLRGAPTAGAWSGDTGVECSAVLA